MEANHNLFLALHFKSDLKEQHLVLEKKIYQYLYWFDMKMIFNGQQKAEATGRKREDERNGGGDLRPGSAAVFKNETSGPLTPSQINEVIHHGVCWVGNCPRSAIHLNCFPCWEKRRGSRDGRLSPRSLSASVTQQSAPPLGVAAALPPAVECTTAECTQCPETSHPASSCP